MEITNSPDTMLRLDDLLRSLGITRNRRSYRPLRQCLERILEDEDRLNAVQKEIYIPIAEADRCDWTAIQSAVRRSAQTAWQTNPVAVQQMAGYPLSGCPTAIQFLEMLYNALVRNNPLNVL